MAKGSGYTQQEFENFARKASRIIGEVVNLGVKRLGEQILEEVIKDPTLRGSGLRGPSGRLATVRERTELGQAAARAVLEINPAVRFVEVYPKTKKVLKFEWPNAPLGVASDPRQPNFPTVYYRHVRVPVPVPIDDLEQRAEKQFSSEQFQRWLVAMLDKKFLTVNWK